MKHIANEIESLMTRLAAKDLATFVKENQTVAYDDAKKKEFKRLGTKFLKELAKKMPDLKETEIYFNAGGIAVSGDFHFKGMFDDNKGFDMFFNLDGFGNYITYRTTKGMKDYSGGRNRQMPFSVLENPEKIVQNLNELRNAND